MKPFKEWYEENSHRYRKIADEGETIRDFVLGAIDEVSDAFADYIDEVIREEMETRGYVSIKKGSEKA